MHFWTNLKLFNLLLCLKAKMITRDLYSELQFDLYWLSSSSRLYKIEFFQSSSGRAPPTPTRLYQAELHTDTNHTLSGRASTLTPARPYQAELYTNANQASSGRAFTSMPTRPHRAELLHRRQPGLIRQSFYTRSH